MQNNPSLLKHIVSLEYIFMAVAVGAFYFAVTDFAWYWLFIVFFVYDLSMLGYLINNKVGAWLYNIGHSLGGPTLLAIVYIATDNQAALFIATTWLFHIFVDRALGYGMRHRNKSFSETHLGPVKRYPKKKKA